MEPVLLTFEGAGEYKTFEPSLSETFIFVLEGELELSLGETVYVAKQDSRSIIKRQNNIN